MYNFISCCNYIDLCACTGFDRDKCLICLLGNSILLIYLWYSSILYFLVYNAIMQHQKIIKFQTLTRKSSHKDPPQTQGGMTAPRPSSTCVALRNHSQLEILLLFVTLNMKVIAILFLTHCLRIHYRIY